MSETIDLPPFPTVYDDMLREKAGLPATTAAQPPDLSKIDLTDVALAMYGKWPEEVAAVKSNLSTLALDLSTPTKIKEARTLRARLIGEPLATARKVAQGIKSKMAQTSKAVGAELAKIEAAYTEADALILPKIEAREAELEREREAKAKADQERKDAHLAKIAGIRAAAVKAETAPDMTADRVTTAIQFIEGLPTPTKETFDEFAVEAANAICETLEKLRIIHARLLRAEQAEAEAAELRARLAAQQPTAQINGEGQAPRRGEHDAPAVERNATTPAPTPPSEYSEGQSGQQVLKAEAKTPDATDRAADAMASPSVGSMGAGQPADAGSAGGHHGPVTMVEPEAPTDEKPTLKLGDINDWLAPIQISAAGLEQLGITHSGTERAAKLYLPSDKARIKAALIEHLEDLA